ncbi:MAG: hypothetical protein SF187_09790 [Deltaproteobacteria bacterium]|nr:hypothetical protein [Deltaproteobacteria bacterium]
MPTPARTAFVPTCLPGHSVRRSWGGAAKILGLGLAVATGSAGCLSDRYQIPDEEVQRQLQLPPERRGQGMHVVQKIGERAAPEVAYGAPPAPPPGYYGPDQGGYPPPASNSNVGVGVFVGVNVGSSGGGGYAPPPPRAVNTAGPTRNPREGMPVGRTASTGSGGVAGPGGGSTGGGASNGGGFRNSGGGRGSSSNNTSDAKAVAALIVVAAAGAALGAAVTEGARFDGQAVVAPSHNVYLKRTDGGEMVQRLDALAPQDLQGIAEVQVSDAEGYGLMRVARNPLNRRGFAFKLDGGSMGTRLDGGVSSRGPGANIQLGYFFANYLGILATSALTGGTDSQSRGFFRAQIGAEAQAFLPGLGPLHLGGYGGVASSSTEIDGAGTASGTTWGAGGLLEIELTTRLALDFRVGGSWSKSSDRGSGADGLGVTVGVAIY